jgi:hypothetical protein
MTKSDFVQEVAAAAAAQTIAQLRDNEHRPIERFKREMERAVEADLIGVGQAIRLLGWWTAERMGGFPTISRQQAWRYGQMLAAVRRGESIKTEQGQWQKERCAT